MRADCRLDAELRLPEGRKISQLTSIYLPAKEKYFSGNEKEVESLGDQIRRYVAREFPEYLIHQKTEKEEKEYTSHCTISSVPKHCLPRRERQAALAEQIVFDRLKNLQVNGLRLIFFQGSCYGGKLRRHALQWPERLVFREHDFVLFSVYEGKQQITLVEVKSTSDSIKGGLIKCDAKSLKNNKRTAQHQLRDHFDILHNELEIDCDYVNCHIFWPFLSSETRDSHDKIIQRWKEDKNLHVFQDVLISQNEFNQWFIKTILNTEKTVTEETWNSLFERFIILSCGVFVDEIDKGMMSLLTQEQLELLHLPEVHGQPLIIHGGAGTGKTMMIICKLQQLYEQGRLHDRARALYICYWPGIRCDVEQKLTALGLSHFVDTKRFFISLPYFLSQCNSTYTHIFMDESEAICLAFEEHIISHTLQTIFQLYRFGNENLYDKEKGALWFMVDINQASLFLPKYSPELLQTPSIILNKVIRSTISIYKLFDQFYQEPLHTIPPAAVVSLPIYQRLQELHKLCMGHEIVGPPVYWADITSKPSSLETVVCIIVDLCSKKGIKPNDLCVLSYLTIDYRVDSVNEKIKSLFVEGGFMPQAMSNVEDFLQNGKANNFLMPWVLRVKGLEFKVVIMIIDDDDFDFKDPEDRRKVYIMASRCTCLLIVICPEKIKCMIDVKNCMQNYQFSVL